MRKHIYCCGVSIRIQTYVHPVTRYWASRIIASVITVTLFIVTLYLMYITDIP